MPALPNVSKVVRADFHFSLTGDPNAQFRKFFAYGGVLSQADCQSWAAAMQTSWNAHLASLIANTVSLVQTEVTDLSSATAAQAIDGTVHAGTNVNPSNPNAISLIVKDKIARRYRGGHPKTYIVGYPTANLTNSNTWGAAALALFLTAWNAFISDILTNVPALAAPATEVNVSYFSGFTVSAPPGKRAKNIPTPRPVPLVDNILSHSMNPIAASQRRRNENP